MKKTILFWFCAIAAATASGADATGNPGVRIDSVDCVRSDNQLMVSMTVDPTGAEIPTCSGVRITPTVTDGSNTRALPDIYVAGRRRFIMLQREDDSLNLHRDNEKPFSYLATLPYEEWMRSGTLNVRYEECGCAGTVTGTSEQDVAFFDFRPQEFVTDAVVLAKPVAIEKQRSVEKSAYIDFPVNKYTIYPDYRRNVSELAGIRTSIDEVKADKDITIKGFAIKGFASPEGKYSNNEFLARERSKALAEYVRTLYSFPSDLMTSSWVAENWEGLCAWLEANPGFADGSAILEIAKGDLPEDEREAVIKKKYPKAYAYLLQEVYPGLRRSDYRIDYTVRSYTNLEEIAEVMKTDPSKLSLFELYKLAESLEPGSDEYREVFEVAVRLYPDEPDANINAASNALQYNNLDKAEGYLKKAGDSAEADYLRGVLAAKRHDYPTAEKYFNSVSTRGLEKEAAEAIARLKEMK